MEDFICLSVVESCFLSSLGDSAHSDGSGTITACGHLVDLTGLAGLLNTVNYLDSVETDVVVATGTSAVNESVAHISKTYAAAGGVEAVEDGKLNVCGVDGLAELLIVSAVVTDNTDLGTGHFTGTDFFSAGSCTVAHYADLTAEAVGVAKVEYTVGTGDLECVCFVRVGGDVECTEYTALELKSSHESCGSVNDEFFTVLGMLGVCVFSYGVDVTAETCYALDGTEEVDHLMDVVTAKVEGEASAVVEREEEELGCHVKEGG